MITNKLNCNVYDVSNFYRPTRLLFTICSNERDKYNQCINEIINYYGTLSNLLTIYHCLINNQLTSKLPRFV